MSESPDGERFSSFSPAYPEESGSLSCLETWETNQASWGVPMEAFRLVGLARGRVSSYGRERIPDKIGSYLPLPGLIGTASQQNDAKGLQDDPEIPDQ